ncbi:MAG: PIN domain-containing protein [Verrucomicrobia bacterium]|nr:PIN domain-containing protein [Verrucomicrobiota bacterium]
MNHTILLDTGPLVAWLSDQDEWHRWAVEQFEMLEPPLVTCEAVLTEACFLYAREGGQPAGVIGNVRSGILRVPFEISDEAAAVETLMARYADAPMSLADACLVRLSELYRDCRVLTLDRHFKRYRRFGRSVIPLLSPW